MLSDPTKAMIALIAVSSWQLSAYLMIIYVAGFTNVPAELVEAARVDGAQRLVGAAQRAPAHDPFLHHHLPVFGHRAFVHGV